MEELELEKLDIEVDDGKCELVEELELERLDIEVDNGICELVEELERLDIEVDDGIYELVEELELERLNVEVDDGRCEFDKTEDTDENMAEDVVEDADVTDVIEVKSGTGEVNAPVAEDVDKDNAFET